MLKGLDRRNVTCYYIVNNKTNKQLNTEQPPGATSQEGRQGIRGGWRKGKIKEVEKKMKPQDMAKAEFKAELAKYGKTIQDWFEAFPLAATDFVYGTASIKEVASHKGWIKKEE